MMDFETRIFFDKIMDKAYKNECEKKYNTALERYKEAKIVAIETNDSALEDVEAGIERCRRELAKQESLSR